MVKIDLTYKTAFLILPSNESKFLSKLADVMIMENFIYDDGEWSTGRIYDPKNGKTYSCVIRLKGDDEIIIRGYVDISFFGRSETWTRASKNQQ